MALHQGLILGFYMNNLCPRKGGPIAPTCASAHRTVPNPTASRQQDQCFCFSAGWIFLRRYRKKKGQESGDGIHRLAKLEAQEPILEVRELGSAPSKPQVSEERAQNGED